MKKIVEFDILLNLYNFGISVLDFIFDLRYREILHVTVNAAYVKIIQILSDKEPLEEFLCCLLFIFDSFYHIK